MIESIIISKHALQLALDMATDRAFDMSNPNIAAHKRPAKALTVADMVRTLRPMIIDTHGDALPADERLLELARGAQCGTWEHVAAETGERRNSEIGINDLPVIRNTVEVRMPSPTGSRPKSIVAEVQYAADARFIAAARPEVVRELLERVRLAEARAAALEPVFAVAGVLADEWAAQDGFNGKRVDELAIAVRTARSGCPIMPPNECNRGHAQLEISECDGVHCYRPCDEIARAECATRRGPR